MPFNKINQVKIVFGYTKKTFELYELNLH